MQFGFLAHTHCAIMMPCTTNAGSLVLGPGLNLQNWRLNVVGEAAEMGNQHDD